MYMNSTRSRSFATAGTPFSSGVITASLKALACDKIAEEGIVQIEEGRGKVVKRPVPPFRREDGAMYRFDRCKAPWLVSQVTRPEKE